MRVTRFVPLLVCLAACGPEAAKPAAPPAEAPSAPAVSAPAKADVPEPPPAETPSPEAEMPPATAAPMPGALPGDAIRAFEAVVLRQDGDRTREDKLDSHATKGTTVYVVQSVACPFCNDYAARIKALEATYMPRGVDVVHVYPNRGETDADKTAWHRKQGFAGGEILDKDAAIAKKLEADHTPTVYVVDKAGVILYRGGVDDDSSGTEVTARYVADALDAHLAGKPVEVKSSDPPG